MSHDETPARDGYERWQLKVGGEEYWSDVPIGWTLVPTDQWNKASAAATLLADLDRCEHGRHAGDVCGGASGCDGPSHGNPYSPPGVRIGTNISGWPIVVPDSMGSDGRRRSLGDASLWPVKP